MSDERKLSQLILEGARLTLPVQEHYSRQDIDGNVEYACALGAAVVGMFGKGIGRVSFPMVEEALGKDLMRKAVYNPVTGKVVELSDAIAELNDYHHWSRERIAEWLQEIGL